MYCLYEHMDKPWPYPERVVDMTLRFQNPQNGLWGGGAMYCRDLDGVFCLIRASIQAGGYREREVHFAIIRFLATAEAQLNDEGFVCRSYPNAHKLTGALAALAECQKHFPELLKTSRPLCQPLDKACFI